ncbi:hypothetical protein STIAU_6193 [Stigmatella aurantiaca DW4/3-1]|uniref:Uncharacterized protein n=1 Tax=Stigmatella aurantiaca (strain DW4/3-1) TaxID=378806 RepID=Q09BV4_STIAD|nr:hypothetical protein STIAU_6193 [Stigmatella aurantiaca DW4/3-1]
MPQAGAPSGPRLQPDRAARPSRGVLRGAGPAGRQHREVRGGDPPPSAHGSARGGGGLHPGAEGLQRHAAQAQPHPVGEPVRVGAAPAGLRGERAGRRGAVARAGHLPLVRGAGDRAGRHHRDGLHAPPLRGADGEPARLSRADAEEPGAAGRRGELTAHLAGVGAQGDGPAGGLRHRPAQRDEDVRGGGGLPHGASRGRGLVEGDDARRDPRLLLHGLPHAARGRHLPPGVRPRRVGAWRGRPGLQVVGGAQVLLDARVDIAGLQPQGVSGEALVGREVLHGQLHAHFVGDRRGRALAREPPLADEPLADVFLVEHLLVLALGEAGLVLLGDPVPAGVRGVHLVDDVELVAHLSELVLGVHEDEPPLAGLTLALGEQPQGGLGEPGPVARAGQPPGEDLRLGDGRVMLPILGLGGRGDEGHGKALVLAEPRGEGQAVGRVRSFLVVAPQAAGEVAAHHHLEGEGLARARHGDVGVRHIQHVVGDDVPGPLEPERGQPVEHLSLEGMVVSTWSNADSRSVVTSVSRSSFR